MIFWIDSVKCEFTLDFQFGWKYAYAMKTASPSFVKIFNLLTAPVRLGVMGRTVTVSFDNGRQYILTTGSNAWNWKTGEPVEPFRFPDLLLCTRLKKAIGFIPKPGDQMWWDQSDIYFRHPGGKMPTGERFVYSKPGGIYVAKI